MRLLLLVVMMFSACATTTSRLGLPALQTVERVELKRYLGTWYELASFPQSFSRGCTGSMATYSMLEGGEIQVVNRCHRDTLDGEERVATGRARVVDATTNAKLEVSFFPPFWGDYWIIQLEPDYHYAVVGSPSRDYLWILSRTPHLDDGTYEAILAKLKVDGHPLERLVRTLQP